MKAVVVVVLWWLMCAAASVSCCPGGCSCRLEQGLYSANCSSLPRTGGKVEALTVLRSPEDDPVDLADGQFMAARHLKYLSLRNSSIYYIHKKAFYGAKSLIEIDLSYNYLEEFEPTVFQQLAHLTTLVLRGNAVQLTAEVPFLISNSLQHLDIGRCQIRSLPRGVFYGLKRLKYLHLDGNYLKTLEYNSLPKGLKFVDLSNNLVANVPAEVLSTLSDLRRVGLGGNPVNCSCSLLNMQDWLSGRGVIFENDVTCDLPSEYYGVSWSKVDENRVCLEEARQEELDRSIVYPPLFKNKIYKGNYFDNENSYMGENIQSDQPIAETNPDSESEVVFQNDDTIAMGEMMRNEGDKKWEQTDKPLVESDKQGEEDKTETSAVDEDELKDVEEDNVIEDDKAGEEDSTNSKVVEEDKTDLKTAEEGRTELNPVDGPSLPDTSDKETATVSKADIQEEEFGVGTSDQKPHSDHADMEGQSAGDGVNQNLQSAKESLEESNLQNNLELPSNNAHGSEKDAAGSLGETKENEENTLEVADNNHRESLEHTAGQSELNEEQTDEKDETLEGNIETYTLNDNHPLEFKPKNEQNENDPNSETDVIKQEGLYPVKSEKYSSNSSFSTEEPTVLPPEDTTGDELDATEVPNDGTDEEISFREDQNVTSTMETTSSIEVQATPELNVTLSPPIETTYVPSATNSSSVPSIFPEILVLDEDITTVLTELEVEINEHDSKLGNKSIAAPAIERCEEKVKQVAGAEVVMFCIAVLITCLILYSIFKCRTSKKRSNTRTVKDMESNRGTEMQDMASLLPKPEGEQKKEVKYPTKAESSETVKLINENNDNESSNITQVANLENHIDNKNSINNNSPLSQNGKTPLIKPEGPAATINPMAPIQRTKAKVGIIPDSIPQTPILIQKSFTNGTKRV